MHNKHTNLFIYLLYLPIVCTISAYPLWISTKVTSQVTQEKAIKNRKTKVERPIQAKLSNEQIPFSFKQKKLVDIINFVAAKLDINIILPQNKVDAQIIQQQTVTYQPIGKETVTLKRAWVLLNLFLELAGFSLFSKRDNFYAIIRSGIGKPGEAHITREPLPLYVTIAPTDLPKSDERIRYIYYLRNLKVPAGQDKDNPITQILGQLLSPGSIAISDPKSNGIIIADKASVIASAMHIIAQLDETGLREAVEVVQLNTIPATEVVRVFNLLKAASGQEQAYPGVRVPLSSPSSYFAADTKIIPDLRNNTVILIGSETAVARISEFIRENIDVTPQSGKSILHTYDLQYLDAQALASVLKAVVAAQPGQEKQAAQATPTSGPYRFFVGVQIAAEVREEVKIAEALVGRVATEEVTVEKVRNTEIKGIEGRIFTGGNRLIIAARNEDWVPLRNLIAQLDQPQPQVILDVAIIDFVIDNTTRVAGTTRNRTNMALPNQGFQYLSSNITPPINVLGTSPMELAQDLLKVIQPGLDVPSVLPIGSTLVSFNDPATPGVFALLDILSTQLKINVISHPFILCLNNRRATVESTNTRRSNGELIPSVNGTFTIPIQDVTATLKVEMIPHLASLERLSLDVGVTIEDFGTGSSLTRFTRSLITRSTMAHGQILALGGLIRDEHIDNITKTPIVGDIPLFGWLFKSQQENVARNYIVIFISPIIVSPKRRTDLNNGTAQKLADVQYELDATAVYGPERDPITHLFFGLKRADKAMIREYITHASNKEKIQPPKPILTTSPLFPSSVIITPPQGSYNAERIKELLAYEDNPILRIKNHESKLIFDS
jgi:general secretion pathway protein D